MQNTYGCIFLGMMETGSLILTTEPAVHVVKSRYVRATCNSCLIGHINKEDTQKPYMQGSIELLTAHIIWLGV